MPICTLAVQIIEYELSSIQRKYTANMHTTLMHCSIQQTEVDQLACVI